MERWIIDWEPTERDWLPYYTRANAGETLPDPSSPLNWTFVWEQGFVPGWVRGMETMGIYHEGQFPRQKPAQLGMFAGADALAQGRPRGVMATYMMNGTAATTRGFLDIARRLAASAA